MVKIYDPHDTRALRDVVTTPVVDPAGIPSEYKSPANFASELKRLSDSVDRLSQYIQSLDESLSSDRVQKDSRSESRITISYYFAMKLIPMVISGMAIYLGYKLFVLGVTGQASLIVDAKGIEAQLVNAAPGLFFAVGGVAALAISIWKGAKLTIGSPGTD